MIEIKPGQTIGVSAEDDERQDNAILLSLAGSPDGTLSLTPDQARRLATELIEAVHKAEVRRSLQRLHAEPEQDYPATEASGQSRAGKPFWAWGGSGSRN